MDFVEICNVCTRKVIIKATKKIFNSDKICCSYYDFYFGVTFLEHTVLTFSLNVAVIGQVDINREHCLSSVNWPFCIILFIVLFINDLVLY